MPNLDAETPGTAVVTGGARGIGASCAARLAAQGRPVVVWDREAPEDPVNGVDYVRVDVGRADDVARAASASALGRVGLLVNAAGVTGFGRAEEIAPDLWREVLESNLYGPFHTAHALFPALRRAKGQIINIASITAGVPGAGRVAYCTSKSGVVTMTKVLALEWAAHGIRVNCVSPGYTRTRMVQDAMDAGHLDEQAVLGRIPQGRTAEPGEIADVILLLTDERFAHVTGDNLVVDGGWSVNGAY
ncbi:2-deoxy-D-gluconate 3-dehydrogenase [Sinosporangium album]|uniref:2-deoxy-D-gluconate 3-dehydrogenase n=1 Tax=Sinosporangium album TaxID=504805 RepID=A0A1G7ZNA3_9ACTN|nr:SDR family oxidoreductase [Sinosporangium album]SDH10242.1 2-deoxy-D-gluconate 3-dehydrogenase [Sinosporangium album]